MIIVTYLLDGADSANYFAPQNDTITDGEIVPKQLTITGTTFITRKVYDGTDTVLSVVAGSLIGVVSPDDVRVSADGRYDDRNVGFGKTITVKYALSGSDTGNYIVPTDSLTTIGIIARQLTITGTAFSTSKVYDGTDTVLSVAMGVLIGVISPDDVTATISARYDDKNIGVGKTITIRYGLVGADTNNYFAPVDSITFFGEITAKAITVTVDSGQGKIYGDADPPLTYAVIPPLVTADTFTGSLIRVAGENIGNYPIYQNTLDAGSNYNLTFISDTFKITAKAITVTVDIGQGKTYGDADPIFTYIVNPLLVGIDTFTGSLRRTAGENVGNYLIGQGTLDAGSNYRITFIGDTFKITAKDITVKANGGSSIYGDNPANPQFTATGLVNSETESVLTGLSNSFGISNITPIGIYTLQVVGTLTNPNYNITVRDTGTWIVTQRLLTVRAIDETIHYGQIPILAYEIISGNLVNGDALTGNLHVDNYNVGIHIIERGTLATDSNYLFAFEEGTLVVLSIDFSVDNILVDGKSADRDDNQFFIVSECGRNQAEITVICDSHAEATINGTAQNPCMVPLPDYGSNYFNIIVTAQNGDSKSYPLTIYKEIPFDNVVIMRWNNTLTVINNSANNGGFRFTSFKWFRNDREISTEQSWSINSNGEWLDPEDEFYVELTTEGYSEVLRTCKSKIVLQDIPKLYPNPTTGTLHVTFGDILDSKDGTIEIFNVAGQVVGTYCIRPEKTETTIDISHLAKGMYFLKVDGKVVKVVKE
jgi:hypothetical protein